MATTKELEARIATLEEQVQDLAALLGVFAQNVCGELGIDHLLTAEPAEYHLEWKTSVDPVDGSTWGLWGYPEQQAKEVAA